MIDLVYHRGDISVSGQMRRAWWISLFQFLCLIGITGLVLLVNWRQGAQISLLGWMIYLSGIVALFWRPRYGLYLIVGLALIADRSLLEWYPFVKNLSSVESLFFLHDAVIISPVEIYIGLTYIAWLLQALLQRKPLNFYGGTLFLPVLAYIGFITFGLANGLLRNGNLVIALWEARAIYYLPALLVLASNLLETRAHVKVLIFWVVFGLVVKSIAGFWYVAAELQFAIGSVDRIAEHVMSIHFNALIVLAIITWLFRAAPSQRILLLVVLPPILIAFLANNRRSAFIALGIALVLLFVVLYQERRKLFFIVAPPALVFSLAYLAVFWNVDSGLGLPASAVRSVLGSADARDQSSNLYRYYENLNIMYTIKSAPLTGVGFGNKFFIVVPMADISSFIWWEYITHNSILWIWMKVGVGGFLAMLFLVGSNMMLSGRAIRRMPRGDMQLFVIFATLYILMHFIFAYVDMSWDSVSMVFVGAMMGLINAAERIAARPVALQPKRWPWQPEPQPPEGLRTLA